ncbi:hypothetical protein JCM6882_004308 [Rhodosporidiobolus microsporus]
MLLDRPKRPLPTTLVLDFHDSYTRNVLSLVSQLFEDDLRSTASAAQLDNNADWEQAGWQDRVVVVNVASLSWDSFVHEILPHIDCVILGPGPGTPHKQSDFSWPHRLLEELGDRLPIFGLCLGCQGLATVFGGKVVKAAEPKHGQISLVRLSAACKGAPESPSTSPAAKSTSLSSLFAGIPSTFSAVQYNSLVVDSKTLPDELEVLAWTAGADGRDEVMALRHREKPLWGVQFHPESIESTYGARILSNFFSLALNFQAAWSSSPQPPAPTPDLPPHILALSTSLRVRSSLPIPSSPPIKWQLREEHFSNASEEWTPQRVFEQLAKGKSPLGEIWLDSARPGAERQYSHISIPQATWSYCIATDSLTIRTCDISDPSAPVQTRTVSVSSTGHADFFSLLTSGHRHMRDRVAFPPTGSPPVPVGFVGHIGYEMKDVSLPPSRRARSESEDEPEKMKGRSDCELAFAPIVLTFDHEDETWTVSGLVRSEADSDNGGAHGADFVSEFGADTKVWASWSSTLFDTLSSPPSLSCPPQSASLPPLVPRQPRPSYLSSIRNGQSLIRNGDTYELCLTTTFSGTLPPSSPLISDPYPAYLALRASNPAPYNAYFHLPRSGSADEVAHGGLAILSSSPERFLRISADGQACMKPIKGTARRCPDDLVEDERRKSALEADAKERAENLMIVDLIRNDLLAVCDIGSVKVEGLMKVETYETVHQLVTTVVGSLSPGVSPVEAVKASFPPGSMTGAPKLRSVQLLDELEGKAKRGVYSGIFGYLSISGASDWSVVIRTLVKRGQELTLGAGGAITHLSEPEKEWDEVLTKVDAVLGGLGGSAAQNGAK